MLFRSHGLVLASVGAGDKFTYKKSRRGNAEIDQAVLNVLRHSGSSYDILDFSPYGYDERQYCSPGFNLPVGVLSRTPHGRYPEYHTSADNLDLVRPASLTDSLLKALSIVEVVEGNGVYTNRNPKGEPQLGRRGLYSTMGGHGDSRSREEALLWVLNLSDGSHTLLDIAERSQLPFDVIRQVASTLQQHELLSETS